MLSRQSLPIFSLVIPSTKQKVSYRPFTVREEKILAQAQQSDDLDVIGNAIKEVIKLCITDIKNVDELALFDVEYIMTKIRSKSVGEYIDLNMSCDKVPSHNKTPVRVNLETIEVTVPEGHEKKIALYDDVGVVMKYPTIKDLQAFEEMDGLEATIACLDYIYTSEEVYYAKEQTKEELKEFFNNLTEKQILKIEENFFKKMPYLEYTIKYDCIECGHHHEKTIKGLSNFFV